MLELSKLNLKTSWEHPIQILPYLSSVNDLKDNGNVSSKYLCSIFSRFFCPFLTLKKPTPVIFSQVFFLESTNTDETFNKYFYGSFDIEISDSTILVHTDLPLNFEVSYSNSREKKMIYAFLRYVLNTFDFSYTLSFDNIEDLRF